MQLALLRRNVILLVLAVSAIASSWASAADAPLRIRWYGQSCFLITSSTGTRILTDPIERTGYGPPADLAPHLVTVSHDHPDHAAYDQLEGSFTLLEGVTEDGAQWNIHDTSVRDVRVTSVGLFHDTTRGTTRGLTAAFRFEVDGLAIVHLGDLGHRLTGAQLAALRPVDVLMIPVGGRTTLSALDAVEVVEQLQPRYFVLPMHGQTFVAHELAYSAADFAALQPEYREITGAFEIDPDGVLPTSPITIILSYE